MPKMKTDIKGRNKKKINGRMLVVLSSNWPDRDYAERSAKVYKNRGFKYVTIRKEPGGFTVYGR